MANRHNALLLILLLPIIAYSSSHKKTENDFQTNGGWIIPSLYDVAECKKAREALDTNLLQKDANGFPMCRGDRGPTLKLDEEETPTYLATAYSLFSSAGNIVVDDENLAKVLATATLASEGQFGEPHVAITRNTCEVADQKSQQVDCLYLITWYEATGDGAPYSTYRIKYQAKRIKSGTYQILEKTVQIEGGFE